ncbi:hypothetical protein [Nostoc sp. TCL26-01]|uniref:hypothetical protein n=1 Tax=Nostoc sp. TCL26-01 TaxID=2576904 RepID=UPI0015BD7DE1|nr:hypothetical protein [Nostoc sp. TCL26-01]QLE57060.1 hypothetical protein FD725_16960 [Nostoc sp. TCL26-01]
MRATLSARFLLMLSLTIPAVMLSTIAGAKAQEASPGQVNLRQSQPFIQDSFRRDTLLDLHKSPIFNTDGGTGKEASDKGKDASDKGSDNKEACDNPCGGFFNYKDRYILPADSLQAPVQLQNIRSKSLLKGNSPIF